MLGQAVWVTGENLLDVLDGSGPDRCGGGANIEFSVTDKRGVGAAQSKTSLGKRGKCDVGNKEKMARNQ